MNARKLTLASALLTLLAPLVASAASPIIVDQPSAKFPDTAIGNGNVITLTYSNGSNANQTITNVSLLGASPADYAVAPGGVLPAVLAPGGTFRAQVAFNPTKLGLRSATVSVSVLGQQTCDSAVAGNATAAAITANPSPLLFGGVAVGMSVKKSVTYTNTTANQVTVTGFSVANNNAEYTASSLFNFPAIVPAGASFPIDVVFTPSAGGVRLGVVSLVIQNINNPANCVLIGSSGDPQVNLGNNAVLFGNTHVGAASDPQMLSVGNIGYNDLHILNILVGGANPGDFAVVPPKLPATIAPGTNLMYGVTFRPMVAGSRNATITVVTDDPNNGTVSFVVGGTGVAFAQSISPAPGKALDFGQVKTGNSSMPQSVIISNVSMAPLNITKVTITGPQSAAFALQAPPMGTVVVKAGGTQSFPIIFSPKAGGIAQATVSFVLDDPNTPVLSAALTGTATAGAVTVTPLSLDFGSIPIGKTSSSKSVVITNSGTADLNIKSVIISGADAAAFSSPDAPDMPTPLMPGEQLKFSVVFTPQAHAISNAVIAITSDDPQAPTTNVALKGAGTQPKITVTPMSLDFGVTVNGIPTEAQNVSVTNSGDDAITIDNIAVNGPAAVAFRVEGWGGAVKLGAGEQVVVSVRFTPSAAGSLTATLTITPQAGVLAPVAVGLKGTGVATAFNISPTTADFGTISTGDTSDPTTFTITNTSGGTLALAPITSTNPAFIVDTSATVLTLAPGAKTTFDVSFAPTMAQSEMGLATLSLVAAPKTVIAKVTLTGEGTEPPPPKTGSGGCSMKPRTQPAGAPMAALAAAALLLVLRRRRRA